MPVGKSAADNVVVRIPNPTDAVVETRDEILIRGIVVASAGLEELGAPTEWQWGRVHTLTLSLMRATSLADSLSRVVAGLTEDFHTDLVRIVLFGRSDALPVADWLILEPGGKSALPAFAEFLQRNEPLCGRLQPDKLAALFGPRAGEVHSAVLMPVNGLGMLAIGSHDMDRFHPGMGTVFLKLIAEAITASVTRYPMC